jgi:hypothetical protein
MDRRTFLFASVCVATMPGLAMANEDPRIEDWRVFERLGKLFRKIARSSGDAIADGIPKERFSKHLERMGRTMVALKRATRMAYVDVTEPCDDTKMPNRQRVYARGIDELQYLCNFLEALAAQTEVLASYLRSPDLTDEARKVADELYGVVDKRKAAIYRVGGFCSMTGPERSRFAMEMQQSGGFEEAAGGALQSLMIEFE